MMRDEVDAPILARVDDLPLFVRRPAAVFQRKIPSAGIPGPAHVSPRQRVADGERRLSRERDMIALVTFGIGIVEIAPRSRCDVARLVWRLRRIHRPAIRGDLSPSSA